MAARPGYKHVITPGNDVNTAIKVRNSIQPSRYEYSTPSAYGYAEQMAWQARVPWNNPRVLEVNPFSFK